MIKQEYCNKTKEERFDYLWENYSRLDEIIKAKTESIYCLISSEKAYKKRSKSEALGVRVQSAESFYSLTEEEAIERVLINECLEKGALSPEYAKEVEDIEAINRMIFSVKLLKNEYRLLECHLFSLPTDNKTLIFSYINKETNLEKLSLKHSIEVNSVKQRIYRIKKQVKEMVLPFMDEYGKGAN